VPSLTRPSLKSGEREFLLLQLGGVGTALHRLKTHFGAMVETTNKRHSKGRIEERQRCKTAHFWCTSTCAWYSCCMRQRHCLQTNANHTQSKKKRRLHTRAVLLFFPFPSLLACLCEKHQQRAQNGAEVAFVVQPLFAPPSRALLATKVSLHGWYAFSFCASQPPYPTPTIWRVRQPEKSQEDERLGTSSSFLVPRT
jgi:hypothetical protein